MPNRLAGSGSPYLRQHADNPVDWFPWGEDAFEKARTESKPVFLSVGYSSCHWCHVMAHESFEDEGVAEILNRSFVSIKVDREERPDVDEAYMAATQLQTGRGGWPMSVFMTPDRKPFLAGTYFPKDDRGQSPGFVTILKSIELQWRTRQKEIQAAGDEFARELEAVLSRTAPQTFATLDRKAVDSTVQALAADFDRNFGGFGSAPKFPPHSTLQLLLALVSDGMVSTEIRTQALGMAFATLEAMALGGIHDHVGGGFHRYSTDAEWHLPHFEKMLYDNALLLGAYSGAAIMAEAADPELAALLKRAASGIVRWLREEMRSSEGLFYSALDADSEGEEGKFYVWTPDELIRFLGDRSAAFMGAFGVKPEGNFRDEATGRPTGANVLHLIADDGGEFARDLEVLREKREHRVRPGLDDKALVGWNGLAIAGLAKAGEIELASAAASTILGVSESAGALPHIIVNGKPHGEAFLEDYADLCLGLVELHDATGEPRWMHSAERLEGEMVRLFYDQENGGFFATSDAHERLFGRTKPVLDQPIPSANAAAVRCLVRLGDHDRAKRTFDALFGWIERAPTATEALVLAGWELLRSDELRVPSAESKEKDAEVSQVSGLGFQASPASVLGLETSAFEPQAPDLAPPQSKIQNLEDPAEGESKIGTKSRIEVSLASQSLSLGSDGVARGAVLIEIPEGVHINSNDPPMRWLVPTTIACEQFELTADFPRAEELGYSGTVRIPIVIKGVPRGAELEITVAFQACTEKECLAPEERVLAAKVE